MMAGTTCPTCGTVNRPGAHFCAGCRTILVVQCPHCGWLNRRTASFCGGCQVMLAPPSPVPGRFGTGQIQPQTIVHGRFQVLDLIAQGGMGAVYRVADTRLRGKVWALKEMSEKGLGQEERETAIQQFQQEANMLAALRHLNLPQVIDVFEEWGKHYLVMEYIEGQTLEKIVEGTGCPLPEPRVLAWAEQLCDVLAYLHAQNPPIIYRDLKPANVMEENQTRVLKLIDFGIARFHKTGKTRDTVAIGTPGYAPPEQYGKGQSDARSDVYALGVLLHHLLTGYDPSQNPFHLPPACKLNPDVSAYVEQAIARATELSMEDRFPTADAFWQALATGVSPRPSPPAPVPRPVPMPVLQPVPQPVVVIGPRLSVDKTRLDLGDVRHGEKVTQSLRVRNTGGKTLQGKARCDVAWLRAKPETFSGNDQELVVSVETADLTLAKFQRPTPNVIRPLWNKVKGVGLGSIGCALLVLLAINLIWIPLVILALAAMMQGIIGLAYWHARRIVPAATSFQGAVELETDGGEKTIGVEVTVMPRTTAVAGRWLAVLGILFAEFVIAVTLITVMANQ
jgi:serine/threonine protein kinase